MNLIIQGTQPIAASHLDHLARLSQSKQRVQIAAHAFRLTEALPHPGIASYCMENRLDYGFVPRGRKLADFGLVVMDMDSTLIAIECIDEIADMQGLKPEVAAITEAAMRGEIDFAESLRRRVVAAAGLDEHALQRVYDERLQLSPGAETMLEALKCARHQDAAGIRRLRVLHRTAQGTDWVLTTPMPTRSRSPTANSPARCWAKSSTRKARPTGWCKIRDELNLKPEQVIAIGDGANDLKMMAQAGISIAYHAKPVVREQASYALNFVGLDGLVNLLDYV